MIFNENDGCIDADDTDGGDDDIHDDADEDYDYDDDDYLYFIFFIN